MPQWRQIATSHDEIEPDSSTSASRETLAQAHKQFEGVVCVFFFFFFVYGFLPPCSKAMVSPYSSVYGFLPPCSHHAVRPWLARNPLSMVSSHHAVRPWLARAPLSVTIISARCCSCLIHSSSGNYKDYFAFGCFHARRLLWRAETILS
jgi:hypothetical protein